MQALITVIAFASLAAWFYLAGWRGRFWRSGPVLPPSAPGARPSLVVLIPARDEAACIPHSLASLLRQNYAGDFSILLVDDNSTDGTSQAAAALPADGRLTILQGAPLPDGWSGKLWAVHQGLAHPRARAARYVLLTDADILHAPGHLAALVAKAGEGGLDLVSEMVRLHCVTRAERALIPAFVYFFQMLYPFAWVAGSGKRVAGAAGGTILVRRAALDRIDGVTRFRQQLIDDCALAAEIKSSGGRIWLGHARQARSMRVYADWREVWQMIARTAYVQLDRSLLKLAACTAAMCLIFLAPPLLAALAHGWARAAAVLAWCVMALTFQPTLRRYRRPWPWGWALPAIAFFYLCATVASAVLHYAGRGGGWKNRVYAGITPR